MMLLYRMMSHDVMILSPLTLFSIHGNKYLKLGISFAIFGN